MTLAIDTYSNAVLHDYEKGLNLSWTLDERDVLMPELADFLGQACGALTEHLGWYPVSDPHGEKLLLRPLCEAIGIEPGQISLTIGAGVGGLIHSLAASLAGNKVAVVSDIYPDFPEWLSRFGGHAERIDISRITSSHTVFLERPSLLGDAMTDQHEVIAELCSAASDGAIFIDESNANYLPWSDSAARLCPDYPNLIVLRGLSKGYGMGSLRLGIAICHPQRSKDVRRLLPALQVASNALHLGAQLLAAPVSWLARLHDRITEAKVKTLATLMNTAIPQPILPHAALPYFLFDPDCVREHRDVVLLLAQHGIIGKSHIVWNGGLRSLHRYSVPLNEERASRFNELLGEVRR